MRKAIKERKTSETDIQLSVTLDNLEPSSIDTGVPFFDHMLGSFARHGRMHLEVTCKGDIEIDAHHSVEDIGIVLGQALKEALGKKEGIQRFGDALIPMDDALAQVAIDLSGRSYFSYMGAPLQGQINNYSEELTIEFLKSFSDNGDFNLHVNVLDGFNRHHIHEAIFKSLGIALYRSARIDQDLQGISMSTKGTLI